LDLGSPGPQHDLVEPLRIERLPDLDEIPVCSRHEHVQHFHHVQPRAQRRVDGAHLQPDDPAAYDEQAIGPQGQLQGSGRIDDARILGQERKLCRLRPRSDDRVPESDDLAAGRGFHDELMRPEKSAGALHHRHLARPGHAGKAAGELSNDLALPRAERLEIDFRIAERDAVLGQVLRLVHHRSHVQQRFGRYAADVEAHSPERRVAFDEDGVHSEVGGAKRGRIAARARP
jgi:hypothetical protein